MSQMDELNAQQQIDARAALAVRQSSAVRIFVALVVASVLTSIPAIATGTWVAPGLWIAACACAPLSGELERMPSPHVVLLLALIPWGIYIALCALTPLGRVKPWVHVVGFMIWHAVGLWRLFKLTVGV
ncbi:MAG: hypothetical protein ACI8QS_002627 [Planctomycetota bacterium]|jgi:hypothetical protein